MESKVEGEKKKRGFPSAFTVLFIVLIFAAVLTFIVPAGSYERLVYNGDGDNFSISKHSGEEVTIEASQDELDKLGVTIPLENFQKGEISKPIAIPGTYQEMEQRP